MQSQQVLRKIGLPLGTLIGVGASAVLFNIVSSFLLHFIGDALHLGAHATGSVAQYGAEALTIILIVIFVSAVVTWQTSRVPLKRILFHGTGLRQPERKQVLILLVSNPDSAEFAIRYHMGEADPEKQAGPHEQMRRIYLIHSTEAESDLFGNSSLPIADNIETLIHNLSDIYGCRPPEVEKVGVSPANAQDTFDMVNRIYRQLRQMGLDSEATIADFTGGTKPMTTGMIMACLSEKRMLEYVAFNGAQKKMSGPYSIDYQHAAFDLAG